VFSTYLYTGNDPSTQDIINGIDLSTKGGMVWQKARSSVGDNVVTDTVRGLSGGRGKELYTNTTGAENVDSGVTAFYTNGFRAGANGPTNGSGKSIASWTFRKQPKFFDIVTYTGVGTGGSRQVAHNLGSTPGCVFIKRTDASGDWMGFHRNTGATNSAIAELSLNLTTAPVSGAAFSQSLVTSTYFVAGDIQSADGGVSANTNGATYVAYLFAHNAGGFGLTGTDNVISCGSYTGSNTVQTSVDLGYEPQFVLIKNTTTSGNNWSMFDNMRGVATGGVDAQLIPNSTNAELNTTNWLSFTSTGFQLIPLNNGTVNRDANTYIYIAIRRGPMKVPTSGTSVYNAKTITGTNATNPLTGVGFAPDLLIASHRNTNALTHPTYWDKLRGRTQYITSSSTASEGNTLQSIVSFDMDGITLGEDGLDLVNKASGTTYVHWLFKRAPNFFDEVCYTGTGVARTVTHNLKATPELMIVKNRSSSRGWAVYTATTGNTKYLYLNTTDATATASTIWNNAGPSSSTFSVGTAIETNSNGATYVAYLFATCAGVSKVGSYTGTGATQTISCGFTGGARFVLVKRTDSTGDWYVWDSARGMVSGTDPSLKLNTAGAEVNANSIYTTTGGFQIVTNSVGINASGGTYIYLAIA